MLFKLKISHFVKTKKSRTGSLNCLTNPQISHRWGSEVRNSPLVDNHPHPEGLRPCFDTFLESCPNVI